MESNLLPSRIQPQEHAAATPSHIHTHTHTTNEWLCNNVHHKPWTKLLIPPKCNLRWKLRSWQWELHGLPIWSIPAPSSASLSSEIKLNPNRLHIGLANEWLDGLVGSRDEKLLFSDQSHLPRALVSHQHSMLSINFHCLDIQAHVLLSQQ